MNSKTKQRKGCELIGTAWPAWPSPEGYRSLRSGLPLPTSLHMCVDVTLGLVRRCIRPFSISPPTHIIYDIELVPFCP